MKIKKDILVRGKKATLTYNDNMFGKDANDLTSDMYTDARIVMKDTGVNIVLTINGEEYYDADKDTYINDFYFEVVDFNKFDEEICFSETIYESVNNEVELLELMITNSQFINNPEDYRVCVKGFVNGNCDEKSHDQCEYSALTIAGLCYAECQDCEGEMFASAEEKAYVCDCSKILFEDRHVGIRAL
ncbi:MAG: hypothetical protein IJ086_13525 [Clostridium sp.]|nr:hypothetical protein [Clostridium sp.]MBQ8999689.1 hypothetical protein [Clostridium sp.]